VLATVDDTAAAEAVADAQDALAEAQDDLADARTATSPAGDEGCGANVAAAYGLVGVTVSPSVTRTSPAAAGLPAAPMTTTPSAPRATISSAPMTPPTAAPRATTPAAPSATTPAVPLAPTPAGTCGTGGGGARQGGTDPILAAEQRAIRTGTTLEEAEQALAGATITTPIAGRVLTVGGKVGSRVSAGSAFVTVAGVHDMQIAAAFPEADADRLAVAQHAVITLADRPGEEFEATVVQVDPAGTSDGAMVRFGVLLSFDEAPGDLLVGQSAAVRVTTGAKPEVLRVPSSAVHDVRGGTATVLRDGARVTVGVGLRGDQFTEITSGLADGDVVVRSW
jgi:HlyD family secretion protein